MKFRFLVVGATRDKRLDGAIKQYLTRINAYVKAEEVVLKGAKARDDQADQVRSADARRLVAAVRPEEAFVHLDPNGRAMTSEDLAAWLRARMNQGSKAAAFGLGGPLGLGDEAADRADLRLCLSNLTLTHEMSRLVLVEQVYRCLRIIAGHPYHK